MQGSLDLLDKYKKHPFAKGLLPFQGAVRSLSTPWPSICAKQDGHQRWIIYDVNTNKPAIFSHAVRFAESHDPETGNFVPPGQRAPPGVEPKVVQIRANSKCLYTYIFDTYGDISLFEGQWTLDDYMKTVDTFRPGNLPRRAYLSGNEEKFRSRFWMQTPMFLRRTPEEAKAKPPSHLHPWVMKADQDSRLFRANPDRPRVWVKTEDGIVPIADSTPSKLQRGDTVAVSFTVTYHKTMVNWFPQFHPANIVLLRAGDSTDYGAPALDLYSRPPPSFDQSLEVEDPDAADGDRHAQRADESTEQSSATRRVLEVIPEEGPMKEEVDCGRESILADDATPVASTGNTPDIHAKEESTIEVGHPKEVTKKRGRSAEDFVDVVAEEEDTYTHRAAKRANRKR